MNALTFHVHGTPVQQGSVRARTLPNGRAVVVHDNKADIRSWRQDVATQARDAGATVLDGPVHVRATFRFARPASVTAKRRPLPTVKPDVDKLLRALLDALTGVAFRDDAQVVSVDVVKVYAADPGLQCTVAPVGANDAQTGPACYQPEAVTG